MVRLWLQVLTQKVFGGRGLRRTSRPAWRSRLRPRFDILETRTVMSAVNIQPSELLPLPIPSMGHEPPVSAPPNPGLGFKHGLGAPDRSDPGWDKLLQDVLAGPRPTGPASPGLASDTSGNTYGARTDPPAETLAGKARDRAGLRALDPLRSPQTQAPPRVAQDVVAQDVARPRGVPSHSQPLETRAFKVDHAAGEPASPARVPDVAAAPASVVTPSRADPQTNAVVAPPAPPKQVSPAEAPTVRGSFLPSPGDLPDGSLLQRYAVHREEMAFAALVQRHEQLVFGVCRRVLGDSHAALDAFQATFLVLARKAGVLDKDSPLAGWLYKVAYHLALRLRTVAARQRQREKEAAQGRSAETASESSAEIEMGEMREALREELQRLPEEYRLPLVLCYFDGQTHDEAARAVGLPRGSMAKRIGEGLERLRERLTDRGFML